MKISVAALVAALTRSTKAPTGEVGDKAFNIGQVADFIDDVIEANVSGAPIELDFEGMRKKLFSSSATIGGNKTIDFINDANAWFFEWTFNLTGAHVLTLPANCKMSDVRWNTSSNQWEAIQGGIYVMRGVHNGTDWLIEISESPFI